ncbi:dioxygenase domain-containing protein [Rhizoctonia solani AG-1 IA]|uniref:Dioxygenase domain-containing protein n=1 Tax=Thanatephorus cucumeris (strain AG1-IA) TaxID=983506 RepID=L8WEZ4_THACA|nr:dioxygenase domain-containing protein [Rhizoctonia solani AG-1 IA]
MHTKGPRKQRYKPTSLHFHFFCTRLAIMLPKTLSAMILSLAAVANIASGHPGEDHTLPRAELHRRQLEANKRHIVARSCASQIAEFNAKRKRALARRSVEPVLNGRHFRRQLPQQGQSGGYQGQPGQQGPGQTQNPGQGQGGPNSISRSFSGGIFPTSAPNSVSASATITELESTVIATAISTTSTSSVATPTSSADSTCVTTPEVTEGPYYVNNELLRQDIREDQAGVELILDIGVMDVTTCTPLEQALVEIWHCNSTGHYSGFTAANTGGGGGNGTAPSGNMTVPSGNATAPTGTESIPAAPTGGAGGGSTSMTDQEPSIGPDEITDTGRTVHIHTMIHTNYSVATNGSIISHAGNVRHIGQLFFDDDLNDKILSQGVYANTSETRTYNDEDSILDSENADGYNAYASTELLGETETDGILAYISMFIHKRNNSGTNRSRIAIGVDPTSETSITSTNYVTAGLE